VTAPSYRLGQAAELLGVSSDTVRRWADGGRLKAVRTSGGHRVVDGADLARFAIQLAESREPETIAGLSARNRLVGIVTKVVKDKVAAQVELQAGPYRIVSLITREAADELGLAPGVLAVAVVKATSVFIDLPGS
jgi:molybdopterin-binding protein